MKLLSQYFFNPIKANPIANQPHPSQHINPSKTINQSKSQTFSIKINSLNDNNYGYYFDKVIEIKLGKTDFVKKNQKDKAHMAYQVCVITKDFQYAIMKRFSLFNVLYAEVKRELEHLNIQFPKRTLLVSGTNIEVVTQRYQLLNIFIKKLFKLIVEQHNEFILKKLVDFIDLCQQYQKRGVKSTIQISNSYKAQKGQLTSKQQLKPYEFSLACADISLNFQIKKLNDYNNYQQQILSRIESYINYKNNRLSNDQIKTFLIGNQQIKGILNLAFAIKNQIKALGLLRFLISYINPQRKTFNQKIYKQFQKLNANIFCFDYQFVKSNFAMVQFKKVFFIILQLYCQNKLLKQTKLLEKCPSLIQQFKLWKNLYEFSDGNISKKSTNLQKSSNKYLQNLLTRKSTTQNLLKTSTTQQKTKSFQISPNLCKTKQMLIQPLRSADNLDNLHSSQYEKLRKTSFRSNNSTSQLTIQEEWENTQMKEQLEDANSVLSFQDLEDHIALTNMEIIRTSQYAILKSNKTNKITIEIQKISKTMSQCQCISKHWNKLIYDQRNDPFTQISRIYMKLNSKTRIFKFKVQDQLIQKNDSNIIRIKNKRLLSSNSIAKAGKQNLLDLFKNHHINHNNGFQEIITIQNVQNQSTNFRKVTIQLNFQGEQDYFHTQIVGNTTFMFDYAQNTFY